jgi:hypothetical protein
MKLELFAFVLMPFEPAFDDVYRFGIKDPAANLDIAAERVDEQLYREGILDRIYRQIDAAEILTCSMRSAMHTQKTNFVFLQLRTLMIFPSTSSTGVTLCMTRSKTLAQK